MLQVSQLLQLPSLDKSYVAAGHHGILGTIKKIEVMEEPYPAVLEFLVPNGFLLTNFWSMKDDRQSQVQLVESMISTRCAGLGIMPKPHLGDVIPKEIMDLANVNHFPIIYIADSVRWGDLISEFCELITLNRVPDADSKIDEVLSIFSTFRSLSNIQSFCNNYSSFLQMPIMMCANTVYSSNFAQVNVAVAVAKIQSTIQEKKHGFMHPVAVPIDENTVVLAYFGERTIIATCFDTAMLGSSKLRMFHKISPWAVRELDDQCPEAFYSLQHTAVSALDDTPAYFLLIKFDKVRHNIEKRIDSTYIIYEKNRFLNYFIVLIPDKIEKSSEIYEMYNALHESLTPDLFIFSQISYSIQDFERMIESLKYTINKLSYLRGVFSEDEIPLLDILAYAPFEYKSGLLAKLTTPALRIEERKFLETLRLCIVIRSIANVATLLGIHVNSVRYRIGKALTLLDKQSESIVTEVPHVTLLIQLELLNLEH